MNKKDGISRSTGTVQQKNQLLQELKCLSKHIKTQNAGMSEQLQLRVEYYLRGGKP